MSSSAAHDLNLPELYVNRELSLLEFIARVLDQAKDESMPLLERLRFLSISSTNLDEFFEIRVAGLKQQLSYDLPRNEPDGMSAAQTLDAIQARARLLVEEQYRVLNDVLLPALQQQQIHVLKRKDWSERQARWIKRYFRSAVLPVLSPIGLDLAHPFPRVQNKSLNFAVSVSGNDAFGRSSGLAIVQVPRSLPRVLQLPAKLASGPHDFVLLSSIIHEHVAEVFPGMEVRSCDQFRVTRNSDLWVEEEEVDDLMRALKGELSSRNYGDSVRLEVADTCLDEIADRLLALLQLGRHDLYRVHGPVNLHRLSAIYDRTVRPDLKFKPFLPGLPGRLEGKSDMFAALREGDVLLHHPYQSFGPVLELLRQAASDPGVLAIKQTLYRTETDSQVVAALIEAARAGKEVTVVIELRARFDEAVNIDLATRLQQAGANVAYGVVGFKTHAKMLLIVRREARRLRRYAHLGTGNYHGGTTRVYTDIGFLTADPVICEDLHQLFVQLTGLGNVRPTQRLLQAPFTLRDALCGLIERETHHARAGRRARIVAKMNSLSDPGVIRALYEANQAGVEVDLIVRGLCCLRPGVPGVSERIRVRSIVGRFLEHSRIFYFHAGGRDLVYCSSADWMQRNLYRRVEACFPIADRELAGQLREVLAVYLADNVQAWECRPDGSYARLDHGTQPPVKAQELLLERCADALGTQLPVTPDSRVLRMPEGGAKKPGKKAPRRAL
jgi:polyphosphate kinase